MKVRFDGQIFSTQSRGGISRYFFELLREFSSDDSLQIEPVVDAYWSKNDLLIGSGMAQRLRVPLGDRARLLKAANRLRRPKGQTDVVHHTYYDPRYLHDYKRTRIRAVTVHDMIPELFPEQFPAGDPHKGKQAHIAAADLIFCVSESTRNDLLELFDVPDVPIVVTHLGVSSSFIPGVPPPAGLPARYVLFVGSRSGYKDFRVLAEALSLATDCDEVGLVAVGGGSFTESERVDLVQLGLWDRSVQRTLTDDELAGAYGNAECFVFPSRYEGFGLPTLEAMASGCVTALAESSSHIEIGGDAAVFFPPGDGRSLAVVLDDIVTGRVATSSLRRRGIEHAARYTWAETARKTAAAYHECAAIR